jgi:hypothetical protein
VVVKGRGCKVEGFWLCKNLCKLSGGVLEVSTPWVHFGWVLYFQNSLLLSHYPTQKYPELSRVETPVHRVLCSTTAPHGIKLHAKQVGGRHMAGLHRDWDRYLEMDIRMENFGDEAHLRRH